VNGASHGTTYRELKTVLFADVAGYARLTESNEELTHTNLCTRFSLISSLVHHHNGVIHRTEGDSVLASFPAATSALQCAVDIQNASSEHNSNLDSSANLSFRIGINCGEVLLDEGEAFGNCVNIAKRLESIAKPGEIIFSETFFNHVHHTLPYNYKYLGRKHLKNIKRSLKLYSIHLSKNSQPSNALFKLSDKFSNTFSPLSIFTIAVAFLLFSNNLSLGDIQPVVYHHTQATNTNVITDHTENNEFTTKSKKAFEYERLIVKTKAKLDAYDDLKIRLMGKYEEQTKLLKDLERNNKNLLRQNNLMAEDLSHIKNKLHSKESLLDSYSKENSSLIEANKNLLTKLDHVVTSQSLNTYENLYAEYNPVRQQIIDIIESKPKSIAEKDNKLKCTLYTNEAAKPQTIERTKGSVREELQCRETGIESAPIPQSKIAEPSGYNNDLTPKEKKVVIYAHIPSLPHNTANITKSINKNIVQLYKKALSLSSLQSYKTKFVLLSPPSNGNNLTDIDTENCNLYKADFVASVRLNSPTNYSSPLTTSALVIHDCGTESSAKKNTRYLLSDSWKSNGELYLTPAILDAFNLQVNSVVELALNHHTFSEPRL